jgi:aspartate aminotransferase
MSELEPSVAVAEAPPELPPARPAGRAISGVVGSEVLRISSEIRALRERGAPVCDLTVGDFSPAQFRIPKPLEEAIVAALAAGETNYPPADGVAPLKEAVRDLYRRSLGLDYPLDGILVSGGGRPILYSTYRTLLEPGEIAVFPVPSWNNNHYVGLSRAQGLPVWALPENGFLSTAAQIAPHLREARLLALNSPLNPSGMGYSRDEVGAIAELVVRENRRRGRSARPLYLMYDQIYWLLAAGSSRHETPVGVVPEARPYTVFVDGVSKAFAATGLRVGWAVGPSEVIVGMRDLLGHIGAWAPRPEQVATAAVLGQAETLAGAIRHQILLRMEALHQGLARLAADGFPVAVLPVQGGLYLSARFDLNDRLGSNEEIRRFLLEEAGFAAIPFQAFGIAEDTGWFRLSVGAVGIEEASDGMERVRAALVRLLGR